MHQAQFQTLSIHTVLASHVACMVVDVSNFSTTDLCPYNIRPLQLKPFHTSFFSLGSGELFPARREPPVGHAGHATTPSFKLRRRRPLPPVKHCTVQSWLPHTVVRFLKPSSHTPFFGVLQLPTDTLRVSSGSPRDEGSDDQKARRTCEAAVAQGSHPGRTPPARACRRS